MTKEENVDESKKERLLNAVWMWALLQGMDEITDEQSYHCHTDLSFASGDKTVGFITEIDRDKEELRFEAVLARELCDYVYVVTDDVKKGEDIKNSDLHFCGILCYSDPSGFGYEYRILRVPQLT